jgi:hypothetical protein
VKLALAGIEADAEEPSREFGVAPKQMELSVDLHEDLLNDIFSMMVVAQIFACETLNLAGVPVEERCVSFSVSFTAESDELSVVVP